MFFMLSIQANKTTCGGSYQQWQSPWDCINYFATQASAQLYNNTVGIALSLVVINNTEGTNVNTNCSPRVDSSATTANYTITYSKTYNPNATFPAGEISRIVLDTTALDDPAIGSILDTDIVSRIPTFGQYCGGFSTMTMRQILQDQLPLDNNIFSQFMFLSDKGCSQCLDTFPSVFSLLGDCKKADNNKTSFFSEAYKYAAIALISNQPAQPTNTSSDNDYLESMVRENRFQKPLYNTHFVLKLDDLSKFSNYTFIQGGTFSNGKTTRYRSDAYSVNAAHNMYTNVDDLTKLVAKFLLGGNDFNQNNSTGQYICRDIPANAIQYSTIKGLFNTTLQDDLSRDANAIQSGIGFRQINVRGTRFWILDAMQLGFYNVIGFYFGQNTSFGFVVSVDVDDDQVLYEYLDFLRAFLVTKNIAKSIQLAQQTFDVHRIVSNQIPDVERSYLHHFLDLFMNERLKSYIEYRHNLVAPSISGNVEVSFYLDNGGNMRGPAGNFMVNQKDLCIGFFVMSALSFLVCVALFILVLMKKDQNKALNLYDTCWLLPQSIKQQYSKAFKQHGFWFCKKMKEVKAAEESSDSDQVGGKTLDKNVGSGKCQITANLINKVEFIIICAKAAVQIVSLSLIFCSLFIQESQTPIVQLAFIKSQSIVRMFFTFDSIWLVLALVQYIIFIGESSFFMCHVTWLWIMMQLLGLICDFVLLSFMSQMQLFSDYNGQTETWLK